MAITDSLVGSVSSWCRWMFGSLFFPVMIPWFLYRIIFSCWNNVTRQHAKLENKVVLITGASSGLGEVLAAEFYKVGCKVILASRRLDELEKVKSNLLNLRGNDVLPEHQPVILQLDLADVKSLPDKAKEALNFYGKVDILINNAGISYRGDILSTAVEVDIKVMIVNYFGQIALTKAILPQMMKNKCGHVVAIGSIQGKVAIPHRSAYSASKHALQAFFDSLRAELVDTNIKVTVINPGYIKTNLSLNAMNGDGSTYGVMDDTTASGMDPTFAAKQILQAIVLEKNEIYLSGWIPTLAIYLRLLCPSLYFALMQKRAKKLKNNRKLK
uniref:Dehydrogenase/reductase SDR family protein 7-like n=1 Tax=Strigamia maritima TaxID=126957 RepID=T1ITV2_STRMM